MIFPAILEQKELNTKDPLVRKILIENNLKLVVYVAKRFTSPYDSLEDLTSIGTIGLIDGIDSFSIDKGAQLSTHLFHCIRNEIRKYFRSIKNYVPTISLETHICQGDGDPILLKDILASDPDLLYNELELEFEYQELFKILDSLSSKDRLIVELRYFENLTLREIGSKLGCTHQNVSLSERKIIKKLRKGLVW